MTEIHSAKDTAIYLVGTFRYGSQKQVQQKLIELGCNIASLKDCNVILTTEESWAAPGKGLKEAQSTGYVSVLKESWLSSCVESGNFKTPAATDYFAKAKRKSPHKPSTMLSPPPSKEPTPAPEVNAGSGESVEEEGNPANGEQENDKEGEGNPANDEQENDKEGEENPANDEREDKEEENEAAAAEAAAKEKKDKEAAAAAAEAAAKETKDKEAAAAAAEAAAKETKDKEAAAALRDIGLEADSAVFDQRSLGRACLPFRQKHLEEAKEARRLIMATHPADLEKDFSKRRGQVEVTIECTLPHSYMIVTVPGTSNEYLPCAREGYLLRTPSYSSHADAFAKAVGKVYNVSKETDLVGRTLADFIFWTVAVGPRACYIMGVLQGTDKIIVITRGEFKKAFTPKLADRQLDQILLSFGQEPVSKGKGKGKKAQTLVKVM
ncbi:hypothetical protein NLG97_g1509 [Lecanicillium saksenae]|uniref:Uncharacterized protein n=1 Tax=Lecanicillium saksenae TaxID=468837 RepID=A0ACC1R5A3_9HYPO|nr:hypothetical protein NLG97_g1509 [Lecanicillium saksenae]